MGLRANILGGGRARLQPGQPELTPSHLTPAPRSLLPCERRQVPSWLRGLRTVPLNRLVGDEFLQAGVFLLGGGCPFVLREVGPGPHMEFAGEQLWTWRREPLPAQPPLALALALSTGPGRLMQPLSRWLVCGWRVGTRGRPGVWRWEE